MLIPLSCRCMAPARQADIPIEERARHTQCMQKALTQMNVQLTNVITDIAGETGMNIIHAIVAGERDGLVLAKQRNYRIHASSEEIAKSLEGNWSCEHLFSLGHELKAYDFASEQIRQLDIEIESLLSAMQVNANILGFGDKIGSIEAGKLADIVAVNEDPTKNIKTMEKVTFVMRDGVVYKNE